MWKDQPLAQDEGSRVGKLRKTVSCSLAGDGDVRLVRACALWCVKILEDAVGLNLKAVRMHSPRPVQVEFGSGIGAIHLTRQCAIECIALASTLRLAAAAQALWQELSYGIRGKCA